MKQDISFAEKILPWLVLSGLFIYTVGFFIRVPYAGFVYGQDGVVLEIFEPGKNGSLQVRDRLIQVGSVTWSGFLQNRTQSLFDAAKKGEIVPLIVQRQDTALTIDWQFPGFTRFELQERLNSEWWLGYIFWFAGVATLRLVRPKKRIWRLLTGFHFLTALWLVTGSVSAWHIWYSIFVFHAVIWLSIPLYWQLHFIYPEPLFSLPRWLFPTLYLMAFIFAALDWMSWLPNGVFEMGVRGMLVGSFGLLGLHLLRSAQRREVNWLLAALFLSFSPAIMMVIAIQIGISPAFQGGLLLGFVAIPGIYFIAAYRTQLPSLQHRLYRLIKGYVFLIGILTFANISLSFGIDWMNRTDLILGGGTAAILLSFTLATLGFIPIFSLTALAGAYYRTDSDNPTHHLELVANRYFTPFLFVSLLIPLAIFLMAFSQVVLTWTGETLLATVMSWVLAALITLAGYPPFKRIVERYLFGLPPLPEVVIETYINRLVSLSHRQELIHLLRDEVLPALQVRESALFFIDETQYVAHIYTEALAPTVLPTEQSLFAALDQLQQGNEVRWPSAQGWVQLTVPLRVQERWTGLWLLGKRDPDNLYARRELPMFEALAAQTAVALTNFTQAETLQALYKANIERHEHERILLAHELHDVTLSQLGVMGMYVEEGVSSKFYQLYTQITGHLRQIVTGLRPKMLDYGVWSGLNQLIDELNEREHQGTEILFDLPESTARYSPSYEQELYRIVQQAIENALHHAEAAVIRVHGYLKEEAISIHIEDNGVGFAQQGTLPVTKLLSEGHFGLVGMQERASLIGATLRVASIPGEGTHITLSWQAPPKIADEA